MKNTYANTKKTLDHIRGEYACKGEIIFRTALQYIVECGQERFKDDEWIQNQLNLVNKKHNNADAENKILFISREFEIALIECAREIAKVDTYCMLVYIQKEVWLSNEGGIAYDRAVALLKCCMNNLEMWNDGQCTLTLEEFEDIGFDDDEIEALGFGYVLDVRNNNEEE